MTRPSWFSRDPEALQFMRAERLALEHGRCPACNGEATPFQRTADGMWVCSRCTSYAYRDHATGRLLYGAA